ncbi:MAG: L,D-transpeptidase family protein [Burkholderiaceae bacterium]
MQRLILAGLAWLLWLAWIPGATAQNTAEAEFPAALVGRNFDYAVQPGDYLGRIGARFGVESSILARMNGITLSSKLRPGQLLHIDNRHIVPERLEQGILINLPQRMLYYFQSGDLVAHYPVALGRPDWATPEGRFLVANLQENKTWYVPKSIQEEMQREGKTVLTEVPPGPDNPLGNYWIGLSLPGIGIHGTIAPSSIYRFQSHGCIRLHPDDIAGLFSQVSTGQPGKIMYAPVLLAQLEDGRIFLEVNRDIYKKGINPFVQVERAARNQGISHRMDWYKVNKIIQQKEGLARETGLPVTHLTGGKP